VVEDIRVDNVVMKNIKQQAIVLDMQYTKAAAEPLSERTPKFRNIRFSNITAYTKQAMYINGLDEMPVQEISLNNVVFEAETGIVIKNAKDIELHNVRVNTKTGSALQADKVERLDIDGLVSAKPIVDVPLIKLNNVQDVLVRNCWPFAGTKIFATINGAETKNVKLGNNELGEATVVYGDEVKR
jgi:Glycosyl hydrolases family 28